MDDAAGTGRRTPLLSTMRSRREKKQKSGKRSQNDLENVLGRG
jgi:hypothetical protein